MKTTINYRWKDRKSLVYHIRKTSRVFTGDTLEEFLTDLHRSDSWLASEAYAAIHTISDSQYAKLVKDSNQGRREDVVPT